jgi:methyl-accepting chemotaxis protein
VTDALFDDAAEVHSSTLHFGGPMTALRRLSIAHRLYLLTALVALSLLALAGLAHVKLGTAVDATLRTEKMRVPQLHRIADIELNVTRLSLQLRHAMLSRTPAELEATLQDIGQLRDRVQTLVKAYEDGLFTDEGRQRYAVLPPVLAKFWEHAERNLAFIRAKRQNEAFDYLVEQTIPARKALLDVLAETRRFQQGALNSDIHGVAEQVDATLAALEWTAACIGMALVLAAWRLAARLRRRVAVAQQVAEQVSAGDLNGDLRDDARDELSPLLAALKHMQHSLTVVVTEVRNTAEGVATASTEIAHGNQDLSTRTERQASALQEAAATMEELVATVRGTADNAHEAHQLSRNASLVAARGGQVVGEVVQAMRDIDEASRRIGDITALIDGIAFQTNILALNAAVEAARAGDQGRGFAVVAGEVRSLAQRSAAAAREIKGLIDGSLAHVERGNRLVRDAGQTMSDIVGAIDRVQAIVSDISLASREQSQGLDAVGTAVTDMDRSTQQNAALVEQAATAAQSLRHQSAQMVSAVAVFRV